MKVADKAKKPPKPKAAPRAKAKPGAKAGAKQGGTTGSKALVLRDFVEAVLTDMKGQNLVILDIQKQSSFADYMMVVTGTSNRHVRSMADEVEKRCKLQGLKVRGMEGQDTAEWVLLDLGDVIVHVMQAATRKLYDLESLWKLSPAD